MKRLKYDWNVLTPLERMMFRLGVILTLALTATFITEIIVHAN